MYTCPEKNVTNVRFQNQPPPYRAYGGGLVFGFLASIFVLRPPKFFWEGFWVMLGSCPDFFGSLSVFHRKMGGVKIKTTKKLRFLAKMTKIQIQKTK